MIRDGAIPRATDSVLEPKPSRVPVTEAATSLPFARLGDCPQAGVAQSDKSAAPSSAEDGRVASGPPAPYATKPTADARPRISALRDEGLAQASPWSPAEFGLAGDSIV